MNYQKKLIILPTDDGTENVTATIAVGTGLGYVQSDNGFSVIAQNLGNHGFDNCECKDERMAQLFIGELNKVIDWTQSRLMIMSLMAVYAFADGGIDGRIQRAFDDAKAKQAKEVAA
jgi:hypothetical protein